MARNTGRHLAPKLRRMSRGWVLPLSLVMMLLFGSVALASDVKVAVVDVMVPTNSVTLAPGTSGSITLNMSVTGSQVGTATFEIYRDWTLSGGAFTGSNPQEFTVGPRAGGDPATTFSTSGNVVVSAGQAPGQFTLAVSAFDITNSNDTGAKLEAGDSSSYQVTVSGPPADTTPPVITPAVSGTLGNNGWYTSDVTVSWTVEDLGSTVTSPPCTPTTINSDTAGQTVTCNATSAGGTASDSVTIKRDATAPTVSLVDGPADEATYYFGAVPDAPSCSATDGMSGISGNCSVSGYSSAVGGHTVTVSATDEAGNTASDSHAYTVLPWTMTGFYRPVDMSPSIVNTVKGGSTVPLKFEVFADATELTSTSVVQSFSVQRLTCQSGAEEDSVDFTTTGGTSLRYDITEGQFVQNWQTPKPAGVCYKVTMTTLDGSSVWSLFKTR